MPPRLLTSLQSVTRAHPTERKLLLCPTLNWGRELLRVLARAEGAWIGWEPMTLRAVAGELAMVHLASANLRMASDVALAALVGSAMEMARAGRELTGPLREMGHGAGVRRAVTDAVLELRVAGVTPAELRGRGFGPTAESLAAVLGHYTAALAAHGLADPARIFEAALADFSAEAPLVLPARIALAPGLTPRGLPGQLLDRLRAGGAEELDADGRQPSPAGAFVLEAVAPGLDCFHGATPSDELREALRRAAEEGWRNDQVELVTTDPDGHGVALDALCNTTGARATMLQGIPLLRTRVGRALGRWLAWLEEGLPVDRIREALEAGDFAPPGLALEPGVLAAELRRLEIGWGRARWLAAAERMVDPAWVEQYVRRRRREDEERFDADACRLQAGELAEAVRRLIGILIQLAPEAPERGSSTEVRTTVQRLARSALAWLDHVPVTQPDEERTSARLRRQLEELAEEDDDETSFAGALATLRQSLVDLRAWTDSSPERQPWSSAGGHLHLTDLAHAGTTGRPRLFFLGMDADRVGAGRSQDPLLPDALRRAIGAGRLATSEERRAEREWLVARALAGSHGRVTLSWAMAADLTGRRAGPAAVVLDAMRLVTGNPQLSYEELRQRAGVPACAVPEDGRPPLDGRDAWLAALADGALLLDGTATVREAWPHLAGSGPGIGALTAAGAVVLTGSEAPAVSASSLELLSKCPLAWFYRYLLGLEAPDDQEYDPDRWLDAAQRGSLLHELFELAGHRFQERQKALDAATVRTEMLELAESVLAAWSDSVPPPSQAVFESERADLMQCALAFLDLERQAAAERHAAAWHLFEHWIGGPRAEFVLPDGSRIALKGRVDRVDRLPDGRLRVVDYKTGQAERFRPSSRAAPLAGGRLLQPALYAAAVSGLHDGAPTDFEYRFPTPRGRGARVSYDAGMLREAGPVVATLLEHLAAGSFVATDDEEDCRFCDYQTVCRVRLTPYGAVAASPRAALAAERAPDDPAFAPMRLRRTRGDG